MEDENGLELSLGLSCGGSSAKSKGKTVSSTDTRTDGGDEGNKVVDDFKSFLHGGTQKQDSGTGSQRNDPVKPEDNFVHNLSKAVVDVDGYASLNGRGLWVANSKRSAEVEEENRPETGNKPKNLFDEISHQKKRGREVHHGQLHDKPITSHISITTDDGSAADNEDVADSEVEGSTSRLISHHDDSSKRHTGNGVSSEVTKEVHVVTGSSLVELQGQKRYKVSSEKEFKLGNMPSGATYPAQSVNIMNFPYSIPLKDSNSVGAPNTSGFQLSGMTQMMAAANSDRPGTQPVIPGNLPLMFSYSPGHHPALDKDNSWGLVSHPQQVHPSFSGRIPPNSAAMPVVVHKLSETYDGRTLEQAKIDGKQHATEEGSSSQKQNIMNGNSMIFRAKDPSDQPSEFPAIRPGIAADLKFGGCGSHPNLPWVSTTGPGPNGRTISGVTIRYSATQIKIVCACHGSHMSPEEFVQHAGEAQTNPDNGTGLVSFPSSNPSASTQS
ncbi:ninja-family protein mc410-like [Cornus florida]|uniref:ninja-family protein mc410-like n=1 Tax=Cornus florida TaxID=4283 RepID=UPI002897E3DB|nr:ninja-family protein mc410-like [Cornus florida]XP_059634929.1 ninja-family protein mc410-like [Cornus florida]